VATMQAAVLTAGQDVILGHRVLPSSSQSMSASIRWTHPSVRAFMRETGADDPVEEVTRKARGLTFEALESGWTGPPFDPFELADRGGVELVAREDLDDARLVLADGHPRIEFNPNRRPARIRFSVAHELGHLLFSDYGERPRHRGAAPIERSADEWQLEMLCNRAAAEMLMPAGAFPQREAENLSLPHLLDLRAEFGVSTEALLNRVVKLTDRPTALFAAARADRPGGDFRVDYVVASRAWRPGISGGDHVPSTSVLGRCTAVGYADDRQEAWNTLDGDLHVQAVGIPPYPGDRFPRIVGLLTPGAAVETHGADIRYVRGDATKPHADGPALIAHVVNDKAARWGGYGFAKALGRRYQEARASYAESAGNPQVRSLGAVQIDEAGPGLWIASMVAQAGYGEAVRPRLRLPALRGCLERLGHEALDRGADVHMPLIGTGQGGMRWATVRDIVLEEVCGRGVNVVVYVLPDSPMPSEEPRQASLLGA
jgi:O-acetyl-ADP-ribose deacetylase (regulator of RNase III)